MAKKIYLFGVFSWQLCSWLLIKRNPIVGSNISILMIQFHLLMITMLLQWQVILANLMSDADIKVVISSHHTLFYNVLCNEIKNPERLFFQRLTKNGLYILKDTSNTPFFYHVALLKELKKVADSGKIYSYHFNILRNVLEKTAAFHGLSAFFIVSTNR